MQGPHGPRKTLKAAQTVIIGISELMFYMIVYNTEPLFQQVVHSFHVIPVSFWVRADTAYSKTRVFSIFL